MPPGPAPLRSGTGGSFYEAPRMKAWSGVRVGTLVLLLAASPALAQSLKSRRDYVVGDHPVGVVAVDYDGDGFLGLITVNQQTAVNGDLALLKGFGDGTLLVGAASKMISTADFKRDGTADHAVISNTANALQIFRGDGTGLFTLNSTMTTGVGPQAIAIGNFNNDKDASNKDILDLAVANNAGDSVSIFLGNTAGGVGAPTTLSPGFGPRGLAIAELDKPAAGKLDLIVTLGNGA